MTENILFEMFKDTRSLSSTRKRKIIQLKFPNINMGELHRKIVNYQVKKYGESLR